MLLVLRWLPSACALATLDLVRHPVLDKCCRYHPAPFRRQSGKRFIYREIPALCLSFPATVKRAAGREIDFSPCQLHPEIGAAAFVCLPLARNDYTRTGWNS